MTRGWMVLVCAGVSLVACNKSSGDGAGAASSAASASVAASGAPGLAPSASAATAAASPAGSSAQASSSWAGKYKSTASSITVPDAWKKVHWSDTQSTAGVGEGAMTLAVDGPTGRVSGTLDGPLGPSTFDGLATGEHFVASVRKKDATDRGLSGTLLGTITGDKADGTMNVSLDGASTVRTVTFSLARGGAH